MVAGLRAAHQGMGDYGNIVCVNWSCDDASRSLHALATGDVAAFFRFQPAMGIVSLLLRAPAVAIANATGADLRGEYGAGSAISMAVACAVAVWLAYSARRRGAPLPAVLAVLVLWLVAILWMQALLLGHPEEALCAVLALAAIVLAADGRPLAAGIALALAIATKEWALLAAGPVLFAAGADGWRRAAVPALVGAVLLTAVMAAGNPHSFRKAQTAQRVGEQHQTTPLSAWFRLGERRVIGRNGDHVYFYVYPPKVIGRGARPFVVVFSLLASLLFWRRRGFDVAGAFGLAAFLLLFRALFDTGTATYQLMPAIVAVGAWEVFARKRLPVVTAAAVIAMEVTIHVLRFSPHFSSHAVNAIFLGWTIPLLVYLAIVTFRRPARSARPC